MYVIKRHYLGSIVPPWVMMLFKLNHKK